MDIKLFTQDACPQCLIAKNIIKQRNIQGIKEVNINDEPKYIKDYDLTSVPSLLINDIVCRGGYDTIKTLKELNNVN